MTYFMPLLFLYTPYKRQESRRFLMFSGGIESSHWHEIGLKMNHNAFSGGSSVLNTFEWFVKIIARNSLRFNGKKQYVSL